MDQIGNLLQQYLGGGSTQPNPDAEDHYDQVTKNVPRDDIASGISQAMQSNDTPPFGQMIGSLFNNGNNSQKAGILNQLIASAEPGLLSGVLSRYGLGDLASMLGGGQQSVTPEQASQVPSEAVSQIAHQTAQQNPSVIDEVSGFLSGHPGLVKSLGGGVLSSVLQQIGLSQQ